MHLKLSGEVSFFFSYEIEVAFEYFYTLFSGRDTTLTADLAV